MELEKIPLTVKQETDITAATEESIIQIKTEILVGSDNVDDSVTQPEPYSAILKCENDINNTEQEDVNRNDEIKVDVQCELENEVKSEAYDGLDFDASSLDSSEARALRRVEACLNEEDGPKNNDYSGAQLQETIRQMKLELMQESGINLEPVCSPLNVKNEEILPTPNSQYDSFQLNSITGDELSLEQEAYGLLHAKKDDHYELNDQRYNCPKCPKNFKHKCYLKKHLAVHASIDKRADGILRGKVTRMENNKKKLSMDEDLDRRHSKQSNRRSDDASKRDSYKCTCGKTFQRRTRLETCLRSHDESSTSQHYISCTTCKKSFTDKKDLTTHRKRLHSRKKFQCKFCPTDYDTGKELFKHLQIHQKVQLMEYKVISEVVNGKQELGCFMCSKQCNELAELKSHVLDDHKEPYVCPRCEGTFNKIIDFANHTKAWHPEVKGKSVLDVLEAFALLVKAWKCEECDLQFHEADKLALHKLEAHSPEIRVEQQFRCEDCRRVFVSQKGLMSHRRVHHNSENGEADNAETGVLCLECRKVCKDITALTSHMRLHSPDRKYPCKFCDFRFATPEKRKAHAEIHTGDMKYVCFICEYQCSSENRLKRHKLSEKHLNMREYLLTGKPLVDPAGDLRPRSRKKKKAAANEDTSGSDDEVACDICGESFSCERNMLEHKQTHPFIEFPNDEKSTRIFFK